MPQDPSVVREALSEDLRPLLDFELANGNAICEVIAGEVPGDGPPLFVSLQHPFRCRRSLSTMGFADSLEWEVINDSHYPREWEVTCRSRTSHQVVSAPFT